MDLQEKQIMLENIISEISSKGHDERLLQQLIRCYLDIYLAKDYQKLGYFIDVFQNTGENLCGDFFGQIIKTGEGTSAEDDALGNRFTNGFRSSLVHTIIKKNESLKQIYTSLGVLDNNTDECAEFWWNRVVNSLADFDFKDLCQVMPNGYVTGGSFQMVIIRENDLRALLSEKGISEEDYSIDYGTMYGGKVLIVGHAVDDMWREEFKKQRQKGLYLHRKKIGTTRQ